jgi:hypothetical protein
MGSARFTYLIDLDRKTADAWIECEGCGHAVTIPTAILFKLFPPTTPLGKGLGCDWSAYDAGEGGIA